MFELSDTEVPQGLICLSPVFGNGGGSIVMNRAKFDAIPIAPTELAAPAEPILLAEIYYTTSVERQVQFARKSEPVSVKWIKETRTRRAEKVRVKV